MALFLLVVAVVLLTLTIIVTLVLTRLRIRAANAARDALVERFRSVVDADAERDRVLAQLRREADEQRAALVRERQSAELELTNLQAQIGKGRLDADTLARQVAALTAEFARLDEEAQLQSFGFYKPRYTFADSAQYETQLERIREEQKRMIQEKTAATCAIEWQVNGSKTEGRKQTNQTLRLMLRAFNGECDAAIAKVNYRNVHVMEARIRKSHEVINGLAAVQQASIANHYLELKLQELFLVHEYEEKLQEAKEEQRRIREQMREEEIAQREIEKARADAEKEEAKYEQMLAKAREEAARAEGAKQAKLATQIEELQKRLADAHANKERAIARAQMTRSGHVYVISNIGSFGEHVYKVGMTRRLDPMDRIRELGDASVPFNFDVHAIIYADDAPALENRLHRLFHNHRVNRVNERKEFFRVSIEEIADAVRKNHGDIQVTLAAEAVEYRKTLASIAAAPPVIPPPLLHASGRMAEA
jgi:hypothetical protein